ncbi:MAG TPA: hypothetical protein VNX01_07675 [Bacteroidia bacterium]|jgi:hypothetical protein|nr:hypothetical protein [Bacteroidia bacterium]
MTKFKDFLVVIRPLWFIIIFQGLIGIALLVMPQGQDMLYIIIEDFSNHLPATYFLFLLGLLYLSITSEFGSRFILYISDISSYNLSPERVRMRKVFQKNISKFVLFLPSFFSLVAFILSYCFRPNLNLLCKLFWILVGILSLASLLYHIYFGRLRNRLYVLKLDKPAKRLIAKLTGIFQPYEMVIKNEKKIVQLTCRDFRPLFNRFYILLGIGLALIILFISLPTTYYINIGALALIIFSFACWFTVYYAIELIDKTQPFFIKIPYKLTIVVWILFVSYVNKDHPLRTSNPSCKNCSSSEFKKDDLSIKQCFDKWFSDTHTLGDTADFDMVFIAAEGGALRTGCFTSMMLAKLQDSLKADVLFKNKIFCYSSVSGGTLGVNFFNGLMITNYNKKFVDATTRFYRQDFLSPVTGRMVFGEIINALIPWHINYFDRAIALEEAWEDGLDSVQNCKKFFSTPFDKLDTFPGRMPAIFINSTEVETGYRSVLSNVNIDNAFLKVSDLNKSIHCRINYSTAVGLSTRFPLVSPAAMVQINDSVKRHYVDGGYYENRGAATLLEVIKSLNSIPFCKKHMKPYVLLFAFDTDTIGDNKGISFMNEIREIISGIYNVRGGHTNHNEEELKRYVNNYGKENFIRFGLSASQKNVPMNWVLSSVAVDSISRSCDTLINRSKELKNMMISFRNKK